MRDEYLFCKIHKVYYNSLVRLECSLCNEPKYTPPPINASVNKDGSLSTYRAKIPDTLDEYLKTLSADVFKHSRRVEIVSQRKQVARVLHFNFKTSTTKIAKILGYKDHTSVLNLLKTKL